MPTGTLLIYPLREIIRLHPRPAAPVPEETIRMAKAVFLKGNSFSHTLNG